MARPRSSQSRRRGPAGPSKVEQRRAAAAAFEPVLTATEPLVARACQQLRLDLPQGYPWFDRSDREFSLHLAPGWTWSVRVRYRDEEVASMQLVADAGGREDEAPLSTAEPQAMERDIDQHLARFLQVAQTTRLAPAVSQEP